MTTDILELAIPILALTIGLASVVVFGLVKLQQVRNKRDQALAGDDVVARVEALEQEVGSLRDQLTEAHERIDFAERLLARGREPESPAPR